MPQLDENDPLFELARLVSGGQRPKFTLPPVDEQGIIKILQEAVGSPGLRQGEILPPIDLDERMRGLRAIQGATDD